MEAIENVRESLDCTDQNVFRSATNSMDGYAKAVKS